MKERITLINSIRRINSSILELNNAAVFRIFLYVADSFNIKMNALILNSIIQGLKNCGDARVLERTAHLTFTCSKSAIKTLEKGMKYVQSQQ